ncbi:MAG: NifU family protein [Bacteroidia bacterium]|nr:NifU family protein [Bacteroidia bacterium]MBT8270216.1 NifU family protein [Bacteroidia bacterium]NNF82543.1 NifU family protein [Flavobacteriaceae bacterium]NNK71071.1 NifU family protein [Flavobacteriaceae bacterium]NNL78871.1 NifU family protein [Flavobacteriaceae bacterium]
MSKITITIKPTSNSKIIKFETSEFITEHKSYEFANIDEAANSPLAQQLFHLPFVKTVYISGNFIAVERFDIVEWEDVQDDVSQHLTTFLNNGGAVVTEVQSKRVPVTVYSESTPNPAVLKFVANKPLVQHLVEFASIDEAKASPLATRLFHFPFVKSVFIDENYVSVTKFDIAEWDEITMELREFIRTFLEEGNPVLSEDAQLESKADNKNKVERFEELDDTSKAIVHILDEYIKPAVASDGGHIQFDSYDPDTKNVKVILQGACSGCPSSTFTLKNGIENMLKQMLNGQVESVEAING